MARRGAARRLEARVLGFVLGAAILLGTAGRPQAQTRSEVHDRIEEILGNADAFDTAFRRLTRAMAAVDTVTIARLSAYPLTVTADAEVYDLTSEDDLLENFDRLVREDTRRDVARQRYDDLIVSDEGVGFANGAVWMSAICDTEDCSVAHWAITGINN